MREGIVTDKTKLRDLDTAVYNKYQGNLQNGIEIYTSGVISPFRGFSPRHFDSICLRSFYDDSFNQLLKEQLIEPIDKLALENGVIFYPGTLWTPHSTISYLTHIPGTSIGTRDEVFEKLSADQRVVEAAENLHNIEVEFDFLFGGNTIALAATRIPTEVLEARKQLSQLAIELGMEENDYKNIYHITLARIALVNPQAPKKGGLANFGKKLIEMHHKILDHPIRTLIHKAELMSNEKMLLEHEAPLAAAVTQSM